MKPKKSTTAYMQGMEAVLSKCRASLTVKEIELLENVIVLLQEIEEEKSFKEKQILVLNIILQLSRFIANPELIEKIKHVFHQFL